MNKHKAHVRGSANQKGSLHVAKFGGSSLGSAEGIRRCAEVVLGKKAHVQLVIVSAVGDTTQHLLDLIDQSFAENKKKTISIIDLLRSRHQSLVSSLGISGACSGHIRRLFAEIETLSEGERLLHDHSDPGADRILSIGERLSARIFVAYLQKAGLNAAHFDAREVLRTDSFFSQANVSVNEVKSLTELHLRPQLAPEKVLVTQGFIGRNAQGQTTTLGRGGSDYTATLLAEALNADSVHIWTDVSGIKTSDPQMVSNTQHIDEISFNEATKLTTYGAQILHPATLKPAIRKNIPVFIGSSFEPHASGTWIKREVPNKPDIRAISVRRKQRLLTLSSRHIYHTHRFFSQIFNVLFKYKVSTDLMASSELGLSFILDPSQRLRKDALDSLAKISEVKVEEEFALIALIGNSLERCSGIALALIQKLSPIELRLMVQGISTHSLCVLIEDQHVEQVIEQLHDRLLVKKASLAV